MSKKIDERLPKEVGTGFYPVKSPWDKMISYREAAHFNQRYANVVSAALMQGFRLMMPDYLYDNAYEKRAEAMCGNAYRRMIATYNMPGVAESTRDLHNMHPFMRGTFVGGLVGDKGDEVQMMCGRVNDFGTYRVEKELDVCYYDIIGSEMCRATTRSLQGVADGTARIRPEGPNLEYHMVEAKGCGDRHCRIVAECRKKYPMPEHKDWECFGPVATQDQIKFTKEEDTVAEPMIFREDADYTYSNGTNLECDWHEATSMHSMSNGGVHYILPTFDELIEKGVLTAAHVDHTIHCVCEAAGKATFVNDFSREALRQWLGVPHSISSNDGRIMGGYIEMILQSSRTEYEIEAFNENECIYVIDPSHLTFLNSAPRMMDAYIWFWYGTVKSLVSAEWSLWEENSPEGKRRIKIARKIDKFN